jgi:ABC-2 type transport system permease protein
MIAEFIIAEREFRDSITSKRFIIIIAILLLLTTYSLIIGINNYNSELGNYKNQSYSNTNINKSIIYTMIPSELDIFNSFKTIFSLMGIIIGISLGFDQVSKEKEEGTIKHLISGPIHRDVIINGKIVGVTIMLTLAMGIAFIITIAILLIYNIIPDAEDFIRIIIFFIIALLYCMTFCIISMMISIITKSSEMSLIGSFGVVFLLIVFSIIATLASNWIAGIIIGPTPQITHSYITDVNTNNTSIKFINASLQYNIKISTTSAQISSFFTILSPMSDFGGIAGAGASDFILSKQKINTFSPLSGKDYDIINASIVDSLSYVWTMILAMIVEVILAIALCNMLFMRMDA